jgi:perosamine synthetase
MNLTKSVIIPHNKPVIGSEEIKSAVEALSNLELTTGKIVTEFESNFAKYIGMPSAATSSGTSALHLALIALGISENDEVILPAYTCVTVLLPVLYMKAKPVLADINDDYNISVEDLKAKITDKTRAVIIPHMFGYPADMDEIREICESKGIYLVEDCCQSIDAEYKKNKVGSIGDISIFSFYATKVITSIQGGMVCSRNAEWNSIVKDLRDPDQYHSIEDDLDDRLKYRYTMSDVEAAIGIIQLKKLDEFIRSRRKISLMYRSMLSDIVKSPIEEPDKKHIYSRYVVKTPFNSHKIIDKMKNRNIMCTVMHIPPLHKRSIIKKHNSNLHFPKTDEIVNSSISLPMYVSISEEEIACVTDTLNDILKGGIT